MTSLVCDSRYYIIFPRFYIIFFILDMNSLVNKKTKQEQTKKVFFFFNTLCLSKNRISLREIIHLF